MANPGDDNYLSTRDGMQTLRAAFDDNTKRFRTDATFTGSLEVDLSSDNDSVAIGDVTGTNFLSVNPDGSSNVKVTDGTDTLEINPDGSINTVIDGEVSIEISAADGDNIAIANQAGTHFMAVNLDGSINITDNAGSITVDQGTTPWVENVSQFGGSNVVTGTGASGAGIPRVTVSNDSNILATQSGAWAVTANAGTNLNTSALALDTSVNAPQGSATGGIAGTKSELAGGIYNTSPPTLTNGQQASLQFDVNGNLKTLATVTVPGTVSVTQGTTPWVDNISQFGGSNVVTGTGASGAGIPRVTISNDSNILATQSGAWTVTANAGTNLNTSALALDTTVSGLQVTQGSTTSGEKGSLIQGAVTTAAPSYTTGQTNPLSLTTTGLLRVDGSGSTQPISGTVTANAGTNLNTSALALDTTVSGLQVSQGSTTSGEKGPLIQGAVTTAAPSYTTAQTSPLSLTTDGSLRTSAKASTPTAGTVTQAAITVGTTAVRATVSGAAPSAARSVLLVSTDSSSSGKFYMGSSSVTSSGANRGFQLLAGDQVAFNSDAGDYYIISDTAGQTVYIVEQA